MPAIRAAQLEGFLDGSEKKPPKTVKKTVDSTAVEEFNPTYTQRVAQDQSVLGYLLSSLTREVLTGVATLTTSAEVWHTLADMFASCTRVWCSLRSGKGLNLLSSTTPRCVALLMNWPLRGTHLVMKNLWPIFWPALMMISTLWSLQWWLVLSQSLPLSFILRCSIMNCTMFVNRMDPLVAILPPMPLCTVVEADLVVASMGADVVVAVVTVTALALAPPTPSHRLRILQMDVPAIRSVFSWVIPPTSVGTCLMRIMSLNKRL
jgi:hypothetical protein